MHDNQKYSLAIKKYKAYSKMITFKANGKIHICINNNNQYVYMHRLTVIIVFEKSNLGYKEKEKKKYVPWLSSLSHQFITECLSGKRD